MNHIRSTNSKKKKKTINRFKSTSQQTLNFLVKFRYMITQTMTHTSFPKKKKKIYKIDRSEFN